MADDRSAPARALLPENGYDASLCPFCAGRGRVVRGGMGNREGWLMRWRRCCACGRRWATVEIYVSQKRSGRPRRGTENARYAAFDVDAIGDARPGPAVKKRSEADE